MLHHRRHFCKHLAVAFLLLLVAIVLGVSPLARGPGFARFAVLRGSCLAALGTTFAAQPLGDSLKTRRLSRFAGFAVAP